MTMPRKRYLSSLILILCSLTAHAENHPLLTFSLGSDSTRLNSNQNVTLLSPFYNTYVNHQQDSETVAGLFFGDEISFLANFSWQIGLSYYQSSAFQANGSVYQFGNPDFANLNYRFQIQSRRVLAETKFLFTVHEFIHPYLIAGAGEAFNKAYGYSEIPVDSFAVPMAQPFGNHTTHSFTYSLGLGVDMNINSHMRIGAGYRFLNLGRVGLNTTPAQDTNNTIQYNRLYTNEILMQFSYII